MQIKDKKRDTSAGTPTNFSYEECGTTVEEYIAYKVVDDSPRWMIPGNLYKVDNLIYSWDSHRQQWTCVDRVALDGDWDALGMLMGTKGS